MWPAAQAAVVSLLQGWKTSRDKKALSLFDQWMHEFGLLYGERFLRPGLAETQALRRFYGASEKAGFHELLFCVHTCFAGVIRSIAGEHGIQDPGENSYFAWRKEVDFKAIHRSVQLERGCDVFKPLYQRMVPREVRHALGEYYTPDWLAEFVLTESGYDGNTQRRLLDPSCGSGTFLVLAIERAKAYGRVHKESPRKSAERIVDGIWGFDLNPLAVLAARVNYRLALRELVSDVRDLEIPVSRVDSILSPRQTPTFDFVVGNPPWLRWDYLPVAYRHITLPLWKHYGLFSLKGFPTRLGAGKKDLSMLFTYAACDRYLKTGGMLGFVITQEVFKSKGAGEGFRRFQLGERGEPMRVMKAHDLAKVRPFDGAANKTAILILTKGQETTYPLPYVVWKRNGKLFQKTELVARPIGSAAGAWQTLPEGDAPTRSFHGANLYRAMLGANANPYGVFWLELRRVLADGMVEIRNLPEKGKKQIPSVVAKVERDLVYPAVRGSDIARWRALPGVYILAVQDPQKRRGYSEEIMRQRWPRTLDYLSRFREELLLRALYRKYHEDAGHPFYSQFNIGVETFAPYKVVWKRMSNDLTAAVVSRWSGPLGYKTVVALETTAFIGAGSKDEAHYLCAVLNSRPVRDFVTSFSSAGRGFGTPSTISHIRIPTFDSREGLHHKLADLSKRLHRIDSEERREELESQVDAAVLAI